MRTLVMLSGWLMATVAWAILIGKMLRKMDDDA